MKRGYWLLIIVVVLIVIGLILLGLFLPKTQITTTTEENCEKNPTEESKEECYLELALDGGEESYCGNIKTMYYKNLCYGSTLKDISYCDKIKEENNESKLVKEICYYGVIEGAEDESLCEKIEEKRRDGCYSSLSRNTKDERYCIEISKISGNKLSRDNCYHNIAKTKKDISMCEKIEQDSGDYGTKDSCYLFIAKYTKNIKLCDKIKIERGTYSRDGCFFNIIRDKYKENIYEVSICEKIKKTSGSSTFDDSKDRCYMLFAVHQKNENICEKIVRISDDYFGESRDYCYSRLASTKKDENLCGKIIEKKKRESCYKVIASKKKDETICEKILTLKSRDGCYKGIALESGDKSICDKIISEDTYLSVKNCRYRVDLAIRQGKYNKKKS